MRLLNRQRVIIRLMGELGCHAPVDRLMTILFLIRHEGKFVEDSFYHFLPVDGKPWSFLLEHELQKLQKMGLLANSVNGMWRFRNFNSSKAGRGVGEIKYDISHFMFEFGADQDNKKGRDYIEKYHSWYTSNPVKSRPKADCAAYTAGYEGLHIDAFLNRLLGDGIQRLIDVRINPAARRFGYHKSTLSRLCGRIGIEYCHYPQLGIRSELRRNLQTQEDYMRLFVDYVQTTLSEESDAIATVTDLMEEKPSVLMCIEADPQMCHRTLVARAVASLSGLEIRNFIG